MICLHGMRVLCGRHESLTGKRVLRDLAAKWQQAATFRDVLRYLVARDGGWVSYVHAEK
jgi:hypothetical protein